jgi:hypothetical protein
MWTYNENNNAKSKASRKEKDKNLSEIYNKTVLGEYAYTNEEQGSFGLNWQKLLNFSNILSSSSSSSFEYTQANQINSYSYVGEYKSYPGGGYVHR